MTGSLFWATLAACLTLIVSLFATAPALAAGRAAACSAASGAEPTVANREADEHATLCLINGIRAAHHLRALRGNPQLTSVADSQVTSMVVSDWFSDVRPGGVTPLALVGTTSYPAHAAQISIGQNIAWGTGGDSTPAHIVAEWMASPPHRAIILTRGFRDAGVSIEPAVPGVLHVGNAGATYAMEFGRRY